MTTGSLQIIEPLPASIAAISYTGSGQGNLLTPDPKEIWVSSSAAAQQIELDLGAVVPVDSIFLGYTNAAGAASASVQSATDAVGGGMVTQVADSLVRASDAKSVRSSKLLKAAAPFSTRYVWITLQANASPWQIGRVAVGLAFEASWDREWGSGRRPIDTAKVTQLVGGGFGVQPGARKAAYNWTFGDLTDAETEQLYGIAYRVGNSSPIIVNEQDGAAVGANEKLHYGLLQRFDAFERREPSATKWQLEIEEWV